AGGAAHWEVAWPIDPNRNPPDKPAAGLTQANFDKIDKGMSVEEGSELLGKEPESMKPSAGNPGELVVAWRSDDKLAVIDVGVVDGKVINKYSSPIWPTVYPSEAPNPRVTAENFAKIDKGMSTAHLVALLGKPGDTQHFHGAPGAPGPDAELVWRDG